MTWVWLHNLKEAFKIMPEYKIRCPSCKKVQRRANWHYQICEKCKYYMYDEREWF